MTPDTRPPLSRPLLVALCAAKLLLHLMGSVRNYGYFRDELYYLDLARHLDWGYVDCAPLVALYARVALLAGGSLAALRIIAALASTGTVALSVLIARELGGGRYAQLLAGLAVLLSPGLFLFGSLMTMNAFEPLFWMGSVLVITRILRTEDSRLWPWFGVLSGIGLENKHSTLFFGFAVAVALLLSPQRRELLRPWIWIAFGVAMAIFLPNLIWQIRHGFPTLEDLENVRKEGKNVVLGPMAFTLQQILALDPLLFPIWLLGLLSLLRDARYRLLGLIFVVFFLTMELAHAKNYYLFPIYPMLFAAGGVEIERRLTGRIRWRAVACALVILGTVPFLPYVDWLLPPEKFLAYEDTLGFAPPKAEVHHAGPLPQPMGDQFGWPEMAQEVADIYHSLPAGERVATGIFTGNYGEAGAINQFGPALGLPRAWSRHQNHWYWGPPGVTYTNLIVLQWSLEDIKDNCGSWQAYPHQSPFGMAEENTPIYLCRGVQFDINKVWSHYHHWN